MSPVFRCFPHGSTAGSQVVSEPSSCSGVSNDALVNVFELPLPDGVRPSKNPVMPFEKLDEVNPANQYRLWTVEKMESLRVRTFSAPTPLPGFYPATYEQWDHISGGVPSQHIPPAADRVPIFNAGSSSNLEQHAPSPVSSGLGGMSPPAGPTSLPAHRRTNSGGSAITTASSLRVTTRRTSTFDGTALEPPMFQQLNTPPLTPIVMTQPPPRSNSRQFVSAQHPNLWGGGPVHLFNQPFTAESDSELERPSSSMQTTNPSPRGVLKNKSSPAFLPRSLSGGTATNSSGSTAIQNQSPWR
ncbi:hypothetical protein M427DRAFT_45906 [Gonapodya prolifera JEL478]|uniref:Uncharacterized protein n=1 Tax=Gonapodya prolifera (strain JEL478) TaxID=1344416 RepID=A0A139A8P2_GONPJ|nr:hypothetical protein M427DRAFT_45906 [Gonapodya prolifera JEL478]|eukprot:KXS13166.1 hypothetical protein M427DRAFT_45906 [Gonapodya prolifera JEL478]